MRTRIGTRVIVAVSLATVLTTGLTAVLVVRTHRTDQVAEVARSVEQLSETIKSSTHYDMLENRRESLHRQIEAIGRQQGIEAVRVFNREGRIVFSSEPSEIGRAVDKRAQACYACHAEGRPLERLPQSARSRTFTATDGHRVLGTINPIHNEPGCASAACHAHDARDTVLGVLDVSVSLADVDRNITRSQRRMAGLTAGALAASGLLLWWLNRSLVLRPVSALVAATRRIAEGDLTVTVPATARHELGDLARAFNEMTRRLAEAQRQLTQADKLASVGRLAAGVAHEINNPLTGVLTYASLLLKQAEDPGVREDLAVIVRETKRCRDIVRNLLDFARQSPPSRQSVDLNEVVRRAVTIMMNQLSLDRVALTLDLSPELPRLLADGGQIQQVVVNLLVNAADAVATGGGEISLATRESHLAAWGHAAIRGATCARGCDLLDPEVRVAGLPAIRVTRNCAGRQDLLHLDPIYGRFNQVAGHPCDEGALATYECPRCRISLHEQALRCERCAAPLFSVQVPGLDRVLWCTRNGCHYSHWVPMDAAEPRRVAEIVVEDTGRGIAPSDLPHLFEPFFTTKGPHGTGLGLAVSWGIVEAHGGTLDVATEEGRGSRFTVRLPLERAAAKGSPVGERAATAAA